MLIGLTPDAVRASEAQQSQRPLVVGEINLTFYQVAAAVVVEVLERLGHPVTIVDGNHPQIYDALGKSRVDVLVASWLPHAHGPLQQPLADKLVEATTLYTDARLFWAIPSYVPESEVSSIDDLRKPDVASKIDKDIAGVGPGSGLMVGSEKVMSSYRLKDAGYSLRVASANEWAAHLQTAYIEKKWMVMPLWQPQYLNAMYRMRVLNDPKGVFGEDRAVVVVRKKVWESLPEHSRNVLSRVRLSVPVVTELERQLVVEHLPARQIAQDWMRSNRAETDPWFAE
ncbi:glycine betaine ABC transporter substrate-binding protein [Burkholderia lata]|nr:glycine betaine ABC transporter substrate-binding protein [Burkholderia lata]